MKQQIISNIRKAKDFDELDNILDSINLLTDVDHETANSILRVAAEQERRIATAIHAANVAVRMLGGLASDHRDMYEAVYNACLED